MVQYILTVTLRIKSESSGEKTGDAGPSLLAFATTMDDNVDIDDVDDDVDDIVDDVDDSVDDVVVDDIVDDIVDDDDGCGVVEEEEIEKGGKMCKDFASII